MGDSTAPFDAPAPLTAAHDVSLFDSSEPVLDKWLRERALPNMAAAASKTYVICPTGARRVIGFYALCMGQVLNRDVAGSMRRNMPRQIPAVILGRLAIDVGWQKRGIGRALLFDAVHRALRASSEVPARLLIVHALSPTAEKFYLHHGFTRLPSEAPTLALDLVKQMKLMG